jgi:hypothetical protein
MNWYKEHPDTVAGKLYKGFFETPQKRVQEHSNEMQLIPEEEVEARIKASRQEYARMQGETRGNFGGKKMTKKKVNMWIPDAVKNHKEGSLHKMLEVPQSETLPFTLVDKGCHTPIGKTFKNPTQTGKKKVKVTKLVKQRSCLALTLKRMGKKRKK